MVKENYNIIDAYIENNKQLIIFISGLSGTNKSKIAQALSKELELEYLNTRDFIEKDKAKEIELPNKETIKVYNDYDWDKIIDKIKEKKNKGIIVVGEYFPTEKLKDIESTLHFHIKLAKQNLIKKRLEYIKSLNEEEQKQYKDESTETLIINQVVYPYYIDMLQKSKINRFINANEYAELKEEEFNEKIIDKIFKDIIEYIIENLKNKNLDKYIVY